MSLATIVESKGFKNFMAKLYGFGAAVVIVGAMFKIMHWPGAGAMLVVGLTTEAIIFIFSAFQPVHEDPDWSLVYPELAGHDEEVDLLEGLDEEEEEHKEENLALKYTGTPTEQLDQMLTEAKIGPELLESLGQGLRNLSEQTKQMNDVSNVATASNEFVSNIKAASNSAGELKNSYDKTSHALNEDFGFDEFVNSIKTASGSVNNLSNTYNVAAETLNNDFSANKEYAESVKNAAETANSLATQYKTTTEQLAKATQQVDFSALDASSLNSQLENISNNLSALNNIYEMQRESSSKHTDMTNSLNETVEKLKNQLDNTANDAANFKAELEKLNQNLSSLNNVYGGMLSAMNLGGNR